MAPIAHPGLPLQDIDAAGLSYQSEALERLLLLDVADVELHVPQNDDSNALLQ